MWESYAKGIALMVLMTVGWVGVQVAWRRMFPRLGSEPDALAVRSGCGGSCGCTGVSCRERDEERVESTRG
ncbi:hypothetical protein K8I85_17045 [bacterium]|nr:hypothetical protein [bacterium]